MRSMASPKQSQTLPLDAAPGGAHKHARTRACQGRSTAHPPSSAPAPAHRVGLSLQVRARREASGAAHTWRGDKVAEVFLGGAHKRQQHHGGQHGPAPPAAPVAGHARVGGGPRTLLQWALLRI